MTFPRFFSLVIMTLLALNSTVAIAQFHKCISNGSVTYQNTPCPPIESRKQPTVEQLNAERKKKLAQTKETSASSTTLTSERSSARNISPDARKSDEFDTAGVKQYPRTTTQADTKFSCDSRKYCSQMTSCAEATYFLSHCPGVKIDGNRDGVPCEQQWCNK